MAEAELAALPSREASSQTYATLLVSYDHYQPDTAQLGRAGYPSFYERSATPSAAEPGRGEDGVVEEEEMSQSPPSKSLLSFFSGGKRRNSKVKLARKRLQVQFSRKELLAPRGIVRQAPHRSVEDIRKARGDKNRKYLTVFDSERLELVGLRDREPVCRVAATLFNGNDVNNPRLFYPSETVVAGTKWSSKYRSDAVTAPVKWATLSVLTAPQNGKKDNAVSAEEEKEYLRTLGSRMLDDEQLFRQQLFEPSQEAEQQLDVILAHFGRRGCVWTRAGHRSRPSLRNPQPRQRPEFMIQGIFPEAFLNRCKRYQANDNLPMPSDMDETKDKERPLITTLQGISHDDDDAMQAEAKLGVTDALEGCSVRVTVEPYRGAGFFEETMASPLWG